ncbi:MAG: glutamine synthetase type III, partial [Clostridia bacterium]|nr:glutamine synthetase type III [Clostridia bacterium]
AWIKEATEERGLLNYRTTADCMPHLLDKKNADMLIGHGVFSQAELRSRCEIMLENYNKSILIEARTMLEMARTQILPAVEGYAAKLAKNAGKIRALDEGIACRYETGLVKKLSALTDGIEEKTDALETAVKGLCTDDVITESAMIRDALLPAMEALRALCDEAETLTSKDFWPFPTYAQLLFGV